MNIQILINGTISGLTLAVLALGFAIVYLPCRVFHVAMGAVYASVPFVTLSMLNHGFSWPAALMAGMAAGAALSLLCEAINHGPLESKQASGGAHLMASLGLYIVIVEIVAITWGNEPRVLRSGIDSVYQLGDIILTQAQIIAAGASILLLAAVYAGLRFTSFGLRFRALADNPIEFGLCGHNVHVYRLIAFGLSGILASSVALSRAYDLGFDPHGGLHILVLAVVAVLIGGRQSFLGPILGGLAVGIMRSMVVWFLSARWQDVVTFLLLALFLYLRPQGICGRSGRLEPDA